MVQYNDFQNLQFINGRHMNVKTEGYSTILTNLRSVAHIKPWYYHKFMQFIQIRLILSWEHL